MQEDSFEMEPRPDSRAHVELLRFVVKLVALTVALVAAQAALYLVRNRDLLPRPLRAADECIAAAPEVLYFGDSSVFFFDLEEEDKTPGNVLLHQRIPERSLRVLLHPAYHMGVFEAYYGNIVRRGAPPRVVIAPLSLRSFAPTWFSRPEYRHTHTIRALNWDGPVFRLLYQPLRVFKSLDEDASHQQEFLDTPMFLPDGRSISMRRYDHERGSDKARLAFANYIQPLTRDHPRIVQMVRLARAAQRHGTATVLYINPIDHERGREQWGEEFTVRLRRNVALIQEVAAENGFSVMDLSEYVPRDYFYWEELPDEHLLLEGRRMVADRLARAVAAAVDAPPGDH